MPCENRLDRGSGLRWLFWGEAKLCDGIPSRRGWGRKGKLLFQRHLLAIDPRRPKRHLQPPSLTAPLERRVDPEGEECRNPRDIRQSPRAPATESTWSGKRGGFREWPSRDLKKGTLLLVVPTTSLSSSRNTFVVGTGTFSPGFAIAGSKPSQDVDPVANEG